ncbi:MAG: ATP-binding protein [Alphaproteobacteria bacterium]|nr:ATP-binding protein [Alphaproteobacteria bacterium]
MTKEQRTLRGYYITVALLALSMIVHMLTESRNHTIEMISSVAMMVALLVLIGMTLLIFRPQLRLIREFRERALLLETAIQSANDAILLMSSQLRDGWPQIMYVNRAFTSISGYSAEEILGKTPEMLLDPFTKRETIDALQQALKHGEPFKDELLNTAKDGRHYWMDISLMPVRSSEGSITHFAAIARDITAKKEEEMREKNMWLELGRANLKAEAATRELQESLAKAEAANKAKSDFLANMSHELRTPMNGVLGMAQLLADSPLSDEQRELVSTINSSGEGLLLLLNDILDFSKIEAGALTLDHSAFNFSDMLHKLGNLLRPQAEKKQVELSVTCDEEVPDYVWGDMNRLRQIITNLAGNAIKFTEHGHVHILASLYHDNDGDKLHLRVRDTGVGIAADKLDLIFDKFTQADTSITRKYGGTGLGLAISKQLVQMMNGTIGVESTPGKGSTFWFTIPCEPAEASDEITTLEQLRTLAPADMPKIPVAEAQVLLVEDYPVNQLFAEKLLRKFGFVHIDKVEDGFEAVIRCSEKNYDIIFMDCQMPKMDGYLATQEIRIQETTSTRHTIIVAMTANALVGDREKCLAAGMDDYLSKPLRAEHIRKTLQTWFLLGDSQLTLTANQPAAAQVIVSEPPAVDLNQLRLFTDGDPAEEKALAELFLQQAEQMITVLEQNLSDSGHDAWKSAAHRFKGSSGNLGASQLYQLCKEAEQHFSDSEPQKLAMLTAIKAETQRVAEFFAA